MYRMYNFTVVRTTSSPGVKLVCINRASMSSVVGVSREE